MERELKVGLTDLWPKSPFTNNILGRHAVDHVHPIGDHSVDPDGRFLG